MEVTSVSLQWGKTLSRLHQNYTAANVCLCMMRRKSLECVVPRGGVPEFIQIKHIRSGGKRHLSHMFPGVSGGVFPTKMRHADGRGQRPALTFCVLYAASGLALAKAN